MDDYILETKGRCFLCLIEIQPKVKLEPGLVSQTSSVYSLHRLSKFLNIDVKRVFQEKGPISSYHSLPDEVKVNVELCEECAALLGTFSKLYQQLEQIEREVKSCVSRIHLKLVEAEKTDFRTASEYEEEDQRPDFQLEIVEALRAEAIKKCVCKLGVVPQDIIRNLAKKTPVSESPQPIRASLHSRKLGGRHQFTINPDTGKYRCNICSKNLKNRSTFLSHYNSSHLGRKYQCTLCDKEFGRKDIFKKHHQTFHGGFFKCDRCGEVFTRKLLLKQHQRKKHNSPVGAVGEADDLEMEIKLDPDILENPNLEEDENFDWDFSEMEAEKTKMEPVESTAEEEVNRNKVECDICHLKVVDLISHLSAVQVETEWALNHSKEDSMGLAIEEDKSKDNPNVNVPPFNSKSGESSRSNKKKEPLPNNDEGTSRETNDDRESASSAPASSMDAEKLPLRILIPAEPAKDDGSPQTTFNPRTGRLKCNICSQEFKNNPSFRSHYKSAHLKIRFKCTLCMKQFRRRDNYLIHNQSVHMGVRFKCNNCNKSFSQKSLLKKHRQTVHLEPKKQVRVRTETSQTIVKPKLPPRTVRSEPRKPVKNKDNIPKSSRNPETGTFKCPLCPKEFKEERYYQEHYNGSHLKMRHVCPVPTCRKDFLRKTHVRRHHESVHLGLRFKCNVCEKSYSLACQLRLHHRTTTCGGRSASELQPSPKVVCHLCGKDFTKKTSLQKHLETVHTNLRKHLCELCGKKFKTKAHLTTHRQGVHKGAEQI